MNDLLTSIEEAKEERQAIQEADGITTTVEELHRCEVVGIVRRYFPNGDPNPFFKMVEEKRGKAAAEKLRTDCRAAWKVEIDRHRAMRSNVAKDSAVNK